MAPVIDQVRTGSPPAKGFAILARRSVAILLIVAVAFVFFHFPFAPMALSIGLCFYAAVLYVYPSAWLVVIPALLPVLDLTPWSGWFFFDEFDLLILTTFAAVLWRARPQPFAPRAALSLRIAVAALGLSYFLSLIVGLLPLAPLDANAFANYFSRYNSLRVAKGFLWAICLVYLARHCSDEAHSNRQQQRLLTWGIILGLVGVNFAVLYERFLFAGIFNFSADLRAVATFSGLNNGGNDIEAYLVFVAPFIVAWVFDQRSWSRYVPGIAIFAFTCYSLLVTFSRGGYLGFLVAWFVLIAGLLLLPRAHSATSSLRAPLFAVLLIFVGSGLALPIVKGEFIRARFATVMLDWQSRLDQLANTFHMMDDDALTLLFGMGLGRFPATYLAKQPAKSRPTVYSFDTESRNTFMRITAGSPLYVGQWITVKPEKKYVLALDIRNAQLRGALTVPICEKQLQKSYRCQSFQFQPREAGAWEHFERPFNMGEVGGDVGRISGRLSRRPVELSLYSSIRGSVIDVDNVKLLDEAGANVLSNGDFTQGHDRWFFTVDDLMPWQTSNHWGQLFFEQGWVGLGAFNFLILCIMVRSWVQIRRGDVFAAIVLSGFAGFLTVGLFGSLFDTPRLATLFYFGSLFSLLRGSKDSVTWEGLENEPIAAQAPNAN